MSTYFKLACFEPKNTTKVLIVSNIIVSVIGVFHWGYCIAMSHFLNLYKKYVEKPSNYTLITSYEQYRKMMDSPMAYYAITGIQQVLTSLLIIAILMQWITINKKYIWIRVLCCLLLFQFAFNFVIAVSSAMSATYYNELFKDQIEQINKIVDGYFDEWIVAIVNVVKYITAEAVISFILGLPLIALTMIALVQQSFIKDYEISSEVTLQKIQGSNKVRDSIS